MKSDVLYANSGKYFFENYAPIEKFLKLVKKIDCKSLYCPSHIRHSKKVPLGFSFKICCFGVATVRASQGEKGIFLINQGKSGNSVKSQERIPKSQGNFLNFSNYSYTIHIRGSHIA